MINFEKKYFVKFDFTNEQIKRNYYNAVKDYDIAKKVDILEVKFNYTYTSFLKACITLISLYSQKARSIPGHHIKIIEKTSDILSDESISIMGNIMRTRRNLNFYSEAEIEVKEKECKEYMEFTLRV